MKCTMNNPISPTPTTSANPLPSTGPDRHIPFMAYLGAQRESVGDGQAVIVLDLRPELLNNHGGGHGGVMMTLLDSAMANAALSKIHFNREVVTIDMHIAFMRPSSGRLVAKGRATGGGKSVCFCEAEIVDASGQVMAKAMGTFRYRQPHGAGDLAPVAGLPLDPNAGLTADPAAAAVTGQGAQPAASETRS